MVKLIYVRSSTKVTDAKGATAYRGVIYHEGWDHKKPPLPTIERADNYVRLTAGRVYDCQMVANKGNSIKPLNHGLLNGAKTRPAAILIHKANWPHEIIGCIAPGLTKHATGVSSSGKAMMEIFKWLDGYRSGKTGFKLEVKNGTI